MALILIAALALLTLLVLKPRDGGPGEVIVLCGGSMRAALEEIIENYKAVSSDTVVPTFGGSGELCAQIRLAGKGDVYICHDPFMEWAEEKGLIQKWDTVGLLRVIIAVPKGNPKGINGLEDLARPGLRIGIGDTTYSTSGVIAKSIIEQAPFGADITKNIRLESKGHQKRLNDIVMGQLDATIVWDAVALLFKDKVDIVPIDYRYVDAVTSATYGRSDLKNIKVTAGITAAAGDKQHVRRFYDYLVTEGRKVFKEHGFTQLH